MTQVNDWFGLSQPIACSKLVDFFTSPVFCRFSDDFVVFFCFLFLIFDVAVTFFAVVFGDSSSFFFCYDFSSYNKYTGKVL